MTTHNVLNLSAEPVVAVITKAHQVVLVFKHYSNFTFALFVDFFTQGFHLLNPFFHAMFICVILLWTLRVISTVGAVVKRHMGSWPVIFLNRW